MAESLRRRQKSRVRPQTEMVFYVTTPARAWRQPPPAPAFHAAPCRPEQPAKRPVSVAVESVESKEKSQESLSKTQGPIGDAQRTSAGTATDQAVDAGEPYPPLQQHCTSPPSPDNRSKVSLLRSWINHFSSLPPVSVLPSLPSSSTRSLLSPYLSLRSLYRASALLLSFARRGAPPSVSVIYSETTPVDYSAFILTLPVVFHLLDALSGLNCVGPAAICSRSFSCTRIRLRRATRGPVDFSNTVDSLPDTIAGLSP